MSDGGAAVSVGGDGGGDNNTHATTQMQRAWTTHIHASHGNDNIHTDERSDGDSSVTFTMVIVIASAQWCHHCSDLIATPMLSCFGLCHAAEACCVVSRLISCCDTAPLSGMRRDEMK